MIDIYVLDKELNMVGIVDAYKSLIWASRYDDTGDCELYLEANAETLDLLRMGRYIGRSGDNMVCRIENIEIDTDADDGNYLIVSGKDGKVFLDQRIVWGTEISDGLAEPFLRQLVYNSLVAPSNPSRRLSTPLGADLMALGTLAGFTEATTEQTSYENIGAKVREVCKRYGWGYRVRYDGTVFLFELYKGTDRSNAVFFSDQYENLASTKYKDSRANMGNVALTAGEGEGAARMTMSQGVATGSERFEIYVDARGTTRSITWKELTAAYPTTAQGGNGSIISTGGKWVYRMSTIDVQAIDAGHLAWLESNYPGGTVITTTSGTFYRLTNQDIAELETGTPGDNTVCTMRDLIYSAYLLSKGKKELDEYGERITFEGSIVPDVTFVYGQDYFLGDIVTVENEFGISKKARIKEVIEVLDDNGYSIQPTYEFTEVI